MLFKKENRRKVQRLDRPVTALEPAVVSSHDRYSCVSVGEFSGIT